MTTTPQQLEYAALIRDLRAGTTTREYFRAPDYLTAKARYKSVGDVDSHVGPVTVRIVGVIPISTVRAGQVVTTLNADDTVGTIGHIVTDLDAGSGVRCFFE